MRSPNLLEDYGRLNNITNFNPFLMRESEEPDWEGKFIAVDCDDNETYKIELQSNDETHTIYVEADDLCTFHQDPEDLVDSDIRIYRLAGVRGWDIWLVPAEATYSDISDFQELYY